MGALARSDPLPLTAGSRLGPYEVLSLLGSGGMGEVYRARDPRLDREVAIKVLPSGRMDEQRRERFVQEARAASALNHPSIVTIHEIGSADGRDFIVMEYVPGKSLDRLIPRRGLPLGEVLQIAIPIADALSRAHGRGIVHRDVKPSNVIVGSEGGVKLLDFGLAKRVASGTSPEAETATAPPPLTREGTVLGTVGYMSPEQASGGEVDARTDVFSLGTVLYEMVTGRRAFAGDSPAATLAAVMREQPRAPSEVASDVPRDLERVVLRCLRKEADRRYQSMADVKLDLEQIKQDSDSGQLAGVAPIPRRHRRRVVVAGLVAILALAGAVWLVSYARAPGPPSQQVVPLTALSGWSWFPTFSPDGQQVAFRWDGGTLQNADIYVKWVGSPEVHRLTTDPMWDAAPSWSPDGRQIAFVRRLGGSAGTIYIVSPLGGPAHRLSDFPVGALAPPSWSPDGRWLAVSGGRPGSEPAELRAGGIFLLPSSGGEARKLILASPPASDLAPAFSPDGRHLAYASCPTGLNEGGCDAYVLDLGADLRPTGPPRRLTHQNVTFQFVAWTRDGSSIVYNTIEGVYLFHLWRVDLRGDRPPQRIELAGHRVWSFGLARTRDRLAFAETLRDVDIHRFRSGQPSEGIVSSSFFDGYPRFSPDGKWIAFASERSGDRTEIWLAEADGSNPVQLTHGPGSKQRLSCWSPDGRRIAFESLSADGQWDIWAVDAEGGAPARLTQGGGTVPSWSRDGRFVYFHSVRDGSGQIWRVPTTGGAEERVTRDGAGHGAIESSDGQTLFFKRSDGNAPLVALSLVSGAERTVAPCVRAWPANFDVAAGGVYYPDCRPGDPGLHRFDPASGRDELLGVLKNAEQPAETTIAVSPDGRTILYPKVVREGSDLRLIENFR